MTAADAKRHCEDIANDISWLLFHKLTLQRKMELLKPKIESAIVKPLKTINISQITNKDIEKDVVPINLASIEMIKNREEYYYAMHELAGIQAEIGAKTELYNTYIAHMKTEQKKQAKPCTDVMVLEAYHDAKDIKNLSPEEAEALKYIGENIMVEINKGNDSRWELYETLQNIITQHG
jgi:hypothetical protein